MIDLHCHILPGVDDGPATIEQSISMCRIAADDGIRTIVATPHIKYDPISMEDIRRKVDELNEALIKETIPVTILPGGECASISVDEVFSSITINGTNYVLVEFPYTHIPDNACEFLFNLRNRGLMPIIAHPERIPTVIQNPNAFIELLGTNIFVQLTAHSILGTFGKNEKRCANYLLKKGVVHLIASDAHDDHYRTPKLRDAVRKAAKIVGRRSALKMVNRIPKMILNGEKGYGKA